MIPSGKLTKNYGKSPFLLGKLTISMAIFNSFLYVYQRVKPILSDGETWWNPCFHHVEARWWLNMVDPLGPETSPDLTGGTFEILCHLQGFHTVLRSGEFSNKTGRKLRFKQRMWGTIGSLQACAGWYTSFFGKLKQMMIQHQFLGRIQFSMFSVKNAVFIILHITNNVFCLRP